MEELEVNHNDEYIDKLRDKIRVLETELASNKKSVWAKFIDSIMSVDLYKIGFQVVFSTMITIILAGIYFTPFYYGWLSQDDINEKIIIINTMTDYLDGKDDVLITLLASIAVLKTVKNN